MGDIGSEAATPVPASPTTLDMTTVPVDELCMTFSLATAASNSSSTFISQTKQGRRIISDSLFSSSSSPEFSPLPVGLTVAGTLVDDPSTITAPFLPGDTILACLTPETASGCILSPPPPSTTIRKHHDESLSATLQQQSLHDDNDEKQQPPIRLRIPTISALELPPTMSPSIGCAHLTALLTGAAILKQELHIPITRTPSASPNLAEESGVRSYNDKRILVIGGETVLGAAMVQLLHRALPEAKVYVLCGVGGRKEKEENKKNKEEEEEEEGKGERLQLLKQRTKHLLGLGAVSATDGDAKDLMDHLSPSFDILVHAVKGREVRKDVMGALDGMAKLVDCGSLDVEAAVGKFVEEEQDCVTSLHEMLLKAADVFDGVEEEEEEEEVRTGGSVGGGAHVRNKMKLAYRFDREDSGTVVVDPVA